jgi:hypothetical protein
LLPPEQAGLSIVFRLSPVVWPAERAHVAQRAEAPVGDRIFVVLFQVVAAIAARL